MISINEFKMKKLITSSSFLLSALLVLSSLCNTGCGIYGFTEKGTIPDSIKTVKINFIENEAAYINPQLSPNLTDKLKQKIVRQTKLSQSNNDNADWVISGS